MLAITGFGGPRQRIGSRLISVGLVALVLPLLWKDNIDEERYPSVL
jgi:hypothetical protein